MSSFFNFFFLTKEFLYKVHKTACQWLRFLHAFSKSYISISSVEDTMEWSRSGGENKKQHWEYFSNSFHIVEIRTNMNQWWKYFYHPFISFGFLHVWFCLFLLSHNLLLISTTKHITCDSTHQCFLIEFSWNGWTGSLG